MTSESYRATFNRSALVRVLSDILPKIAEPKYDFGEHLGQWLDFSDAMTLYSVLNREAGGATSISTAIADLAAELVRVRDNLSTSIQNDGVFNREPSDTPIRIPFPRPLPNASAASAADFSPYHRYYLAHQRDMNTAITALRANARKALASQSAAGKQLADLDITFEQFLSIRERNLLANIPILLGRRFDQRYAEYRDALSEARTDDSAEWIRPGSWLEAFCHDAQTMLLAELELRLKPVSGLIAALIAGPVSEINETKPS
jgi:microcystin-dependent protein